MVVFAILPAIGARTVPRRRMAGQNEPHSDPGSGSQPCEHPQLRDRSADGVTATRASNHRSWVVAANSDADRSREDSSSKVTASRQRHSWPSPESRHHVFRTVRALPPHKSEWYSLIVGVTSTIMRRIPPDSRYQGFAAGNRCGFGGKQE